MSKRLGFVAPKGPPTIEIDSEAGAAYVRFSRNKVKATKLVDVDGCVVTVDLDERGMVIGVELIGVHEFSVGALCERMPFKVSRGAMNKAKVVAAA